MADNDQPIAGPAPAGLGPAGTQQDPPSQASAAADPAGVLPAAAAEPAAAAIVPAADADGGAKPAAAVAVKSELTSDQPTLLEGAAVKDPLKPADAKDVKLEAKPAEAAKPGEEPKPVDPAAAAAAAAAQPEPLAPIEYKYTLPETLTLDDALRNDVHAAFDAFRADPSQGAQQLVDLHERTMRNYAEGLALEQHRAFNRTREGWRTEVMADKEIGGAGHQTAMQATARVRDALAGSDLQAPRQWPDGSARPSELDEFLRVTGAGDHPVFLKILHRAARFIDEPQAAEIPTNPKPPPNNGRPSGRGRALIYDHPSSQK